MKRLLVLAVAVLFGVSFSAAQERQHHRSNRSDEKRETAVDESVIQSQWDGAHISFVKSKHDFGEVRRKGGDLKVKFE